jgi:hypothetical protein
MDTSEIPQKKTYKKNDKEYHRQYYLSNGKAKIIEYNKMRHNQLVFCSSCDVMVHSDYKLRHDKTRKHIKNLENESKKETKIESKTETIDKNKMELLQNAIEEIYKVVFDGEKQPKISISVK